MAASVPEYLPNLRQLFEETEEKEGER